LEAKVDWEETRVDWEEYMDGDGAGLEGVRDEPE
jgi:hypothetical protein